jgi:hypothetical protein
MRSLRISIPCRDTSEVDIELGSTGVGDAPREQIKGMGLCNMTGLGGNEVQLG